MFCSKQVMIGASKNIWGFDPRLIGRCVLWLDSSDRDTLFTDVAGTTPVTTGTQTIAHWKDKSSSGANVTNATVGPSYINSSPLGGLNFSSSKQLGGTRPSFSSGGICAFCVFNPTATSVAGRGRMFRIYNGAYLASLDSTVVDIGTASIYHYQQNLRSIANVNNLYSVMAYGPTQAEYNVNFGYSSTTWEFTSGPQSTGNVLELGATATVPFSGTISEIIVFDSFLTVQDKRVIEGYLGSKWGLPASTFNPSTIPNCIVWYDADDPTKFTGGTTWLASTGTNHAINGTAGITAMPTVTTWSNGRRAARFQAGRKNSMKTTNTITNFVSYFFVTRITSAAPVYGFIMINNLDGQRQFVMNTSTFPVPLFWSPGGTAINLGSFQQNQGLVFCGTVTSGSAVGFINGVQVGSNTNPSTSGVSQNYFGSANGDGGYLSIDLAEVLIYTGVISAPNRALVENYLIRKWGLDFQTPPTHPFFYTRPYLRNFQPNDIDQCILWLDANDPSGSGLIPTTGNPISIWIDKSSNGNSGTGTTGPIFTTDAQGRRCMSFTGTQWLESLARVLSTNHTLIAVHAPTYTTGSDGTGTFGGNSSLFRFQAIGSFIVFPYYNTIRRGYVSSFGLGSSDTSLPDNSVAGTVNISIANIQTSVQAIHRNGTQQNSASSTFGLGTSSTLTIGRYTPGLNEYYQGLVYEMLIYNTSITTVEREKIEDYLANKWGLQSSFPTTPFNTTITFNHTGSIQLWICPIGVTSVSVNVRGAGGGAGGTSGVAPGGAGGNVAGTMAVIPGQTYYLVVGGTGTASGGPGGYGGGGSSIPFFGAGGGGGGGYSGVFTEITPTQQNALVIAGGGGGGASGNGGNPAGGAGGGDTGVTSVGSQGGGGGGQSAGGVSVINAAGNGSELQGGNGTNEAAGGGGGFWGGGMGIGGGGGSGFKAGLTTVTTNTQGGGGASNTNGSIVLQYRINDFTIASTLPFLPTSIPGCQLWLDGADPAGTRVVPADGSTVSTWVDKSGNGRNALPNAGGSAITMGTLNNLPAITFPAASTAAFLPPFLSVGSNGYSVFFVARQTAFAIGGTRIYAANGGGIQSFVDNTPTPRILSVYNGSSITSSFTVLADTPFLYSYTISSTAAGLWKNGIPAGISGGSTAAISNFYIGNISTPEAQYAFTGQMGEFLVYNTALTTSQRQRVEVYLSQKWGLTLAPLLPLTNPTTIPGCQLWFDAADSSTVTFSSGSNISIWTNKGTVATTATPSRGATGNQVTYVTIDGYPGVYINNNGSANFNASTYSQLTIQSNFQNTADYSIFAVVNLSNVANGPDFQTIYVNARGATGETRSPNFGAGRSLEFNADGTNRSINGAFIGTGRLQTALISSSSSLTAFTNGIIYGSALNAYTRPSTDVGALPMIGGTFGAASGGSDNRFTTGYFHEILLYNSVLSESQRQQVEGYLASKWNTSYISQLISPYSTIPPAVSPSQSFLFSPLSFGGLTLWLDGNDPLGTGIQPANGASVTTWVDKSPNGYNATAAPSRTVGTYSTSLRAVNFPNSTTGYITGYFPSATSETMFVVFNNAAPSLNNNILIGGVQGARSLGAGYSGNGGATVNVVGNLNTQVAWLATTAAGSYPSGTTAIVTSTFTSSANTISINGGTFTASGGAPNFTVGRVTYLGVDATNGAYYYIGHAMEIIFYSKILSTTERQIVEGYLAWKWGTVASLASGHPYKTFPPAPS